MSTVEMSAEERLEQLTARLSELEDKQALTSLLSRYARAVDSFDWDAWAECWAPDAVVDWGDYGQIEGREAIVKASRDAETIYEARGGMQHLLAGLEFDVDGDTAQGYGSLIFACTLNAKKAAQDFACGGRYTWTFKRGDAGWQIAHAQLTTDWFVGPDVAGTFSR